MEEINNVYTEIIYIKIYYYRDADRIKIKSNEKIKKMGKIVKLRASQKISL